MSRAHLLDMHVCSAPPSNVHHHVHHDHHAHLLDMHVHRHPLLRDPSHVLGAPDVDIGDATQNKG